MEAVVLSPWAQRVWSQHAWQAGVLSKPAGRGHRLAIAGACFIAFLSTLLYAETSCAAEPGEAEPAEAAESEVVAAGDHLFGDPGHFRSKLESRGLGLDVLYVGEVLANLSGGVRRGAVYEGLLKIQVDLDAEKLGILPGASWHVSGLYPHGRSASQHYLGDLFTFSNIDAAHEPRLFELWGQQRFVQDRLSLRVGQLAADEEFAYTDYGGIFINGAYGWPAPISLNVPSPAYPVATPGVRVEGQILEAWSLRVAAYNGQPYPLDDQGDPLNPHGIYWKLQDALVLAESQWNWPRQTDSGPLPGTAKVGVWYHTGLFSDTRLDDTGRSLADPASTGQPRAVRGNWGLYLIGEQQVWREESPDQGVALFTRVAGTPADANLIDLYLEGGVNYTGLIPTRDQDAFGAAVVYGRIRRDARWLVADANACRETKEPLPDFEQAFEATYRVVLRAGMAMQPVVGYVTHPGGSPGHDALVLGLRTTIDF
ncbi:MAG: carbohydrate porin [Verrucomicrobiota bacterium]